MSRTWLLALFTLVWLGMPITIFAANEIVSKKPFAAEISWMYYYLGYEEDLELPEKSKERGWLNGGRFDLYYRGTEHLNHENNVYIRLFLEYTQAETTYDGALIDLSTGDVEGYEDKTNNVFFTVEGDFGFIIARVEAPYDFIPYSGLGLRNWVRQLKGVSAYKEEYSWLYLPLGLQADYEFSKNFTASIDASYRIMLLGNIKIYLSEIDSHFNDPVAMLGNRPGWRLAAPLRYRFLVLTPWYEYSAIGESSSADWTYTYDGVEYLIGEVYEPASETRQSGINLGVIIKF